MREILFRGKRCDNGEWVQGCLVKFGKESFTDDDRYGIMDKTVLVAKTHKNHCGSLVFGYCDYVYHNIRIAEIIPKSVGQLTGLTDKNGKKIFEGDILDCKSGLYDRCKVIYNEFCSAFQLECADGFSDFFLCSINHKEMEIIGNIHDNPELLENP